MKNRHHIVGATLLIAGTCIGVGMLALPVATAEGGFFASLPVYLVVWLFMLCTSRLIVEACLWCPNDANLITISQTLLGKKGAIACWLRTISTHPIRKPVWTSFLWRIQIPLM